MEVLQEEWRNLGRRLATLEKATAKAQRSVDVEEAAMAKKRAALTLALKEEMEVRQRYLDILQKLKGESQE